MRSPNELRRKTHSSLVATQIFQPKSSVKIRACIFTKLKIKIHT